MHYDAVCRIPDRMDLLIILKEAVCSAGRSDRDRQTNLISVIYYATVLIAVSI